MPTKWDRFQQTVERAHDSFGFPECEFFTANSSYDATTGDLEKTYTSIGTLACEFIPPSADASVDNQGTHLDFDTSIRIPQDDLSILTYGDGAYGSGLYGGTLTLDSIGYGEDSEWPIRVEARGTTYEIQAAIPEDGSNMIMFRLTEV